MCSCFCQNNWNQRMEKMGPFQRPVQITALTNHWRLIEQKLPNPRAEFWKWLDDADLPWPLTPALIWASNTAIRLEQTSTSITFTDLLPCDSQRPQVVLNHTATAEAEKLKWKSPLVCWFPLYLYSAWIINSHLDDWKRGTLLWSAHIRNHLKMQSPLHFPFFLTFNQIRTRNVMASIKGRVGECHWPTFGTHI